MNPPSDLEKYLNDCSDDGQTVDTDQSFSISREKALQKLAAFQMPFPGAWALKVVQCAVAAESITGIKIDLTVKETTFSLYGQLGFTLDDVEEAFYNPDYSSRRDLAHLVSGLRSIGYNDMHPWSLSMNDSVALFWEGEALQRVTRGSRYEPVALQLIVSNYPKGERPTVMGFLATLTGSGVNADLTRVVSARAHVCPIPLIMDGRRIDALQNDPGHGWSKESQLLAMGFQDSDLPTMGVPQNTFTHLVPSEVTVESWMQTMSEELRTVDETQTLYSFGFLFAAHMRRVKSGKSYVWKDAESLSMLNWVLDGVVIQHQALNQWSRFFSAGCFVSALGIATDITGFKLHECPEKEERVRTCKRLLHNALDQTKRLDFEEMHKSQLKNDRIVGGVMVVVGTLCLVGNPLFGLVVGGVGALCLFSDSTDAQKRQLQVSECVARLKEDLTKP